MARAKSLAGRRIIIIEDEPLISAEFETAFQDDGGEVIGTATTVVEAMRLIRATDHLDGTVLDINLAGEMAFPVAEALAERHIPFVFATGYQHDVVPSQFAHIAHCEKPIDPADVAEALFPAGTPRWA